jgi:ABC-type sugar transport system substrate-binding protein
MKPLNFLVSLTTADNDYQTEQAQAAEKAAKRLGVGVEVVYAENDAVTQSQQLLKSIQATQRPDAIVLEPVSNTAMPQVARAALTAGIGWVVLNAYPGYVTEFRKQFRVPLFALTSNHEEIGRIQGQQLAALLPHGGQVLHIQGPTANSAASERTTGTLHSKPENIRLKVLKGQWTEASSHRAVTSWLALSTSRDARIDAVAAQDDSMAMGARRAFEERTRGDDQKRLLAVPFLGCDGLPATGQSWVRNGLLRATVFVPPNSDLALQMLVDALRNGIQHAEQTFTTPVSIPSLAELASKRMTASNSNT